MSSVYDLPFDEYMRARTEMAIESKFFKYFPGAECLIFAQALWARQYWFYKNGGEMV